MNIGDLVGSVLQTFGDAVPGLQQAIEYDRMKKMDEEEKKRYQEGLGFKQRQEVRDIDRVGKEDEYRELQKDSLFREIISSSAESYAAVGDNEGFDKWMDTFLKNAKISDTTKSSYFYYSGKALFKKMEKEVKRGDELALAQLSASYKQAGYVPEISELRKDKNLMDIIKRDREYQDLQSKLLSTQSDESKMRMLGTIMGLVPKSTMRNTKENTDGSTQEIFSEIWNEEDAKKIMSVAEGMGLKLPGDFINTIGQEGVKYEEKRDPSFDKYVKARGNQSFNVPGIKNIFDERRKQESLSTGMLGLSGVGELGIPGNTMAIPQESGPNPMNMQNILGTVKRNVYDPAFMTGEHETPLVRQLRDRFNIK